ncbi:unnamed protein product [Haemonchus placei]|uniref:Uncharacterized protein n=1 Tax=Haemonchus placei TaxID=6290 RepID=A0A0N4X9E0_HAEPC|nr:unnamed protein product [Haemonchus placei]
MKNEVKLKASGQRAQDTRNKRLCTCMELIHYLKVAVETARQQAVTYPFHGRSNRGSRIGHVVHYGTACHRSVMRVFSKSKAFKVKVAVLQRHPQISMADKVLLLGNYLAAGEYPSSTVRPKENVSIWLAILHKLDKLFARIFQMKPSSLRRASSMDDAFDGFFVDFCSVGVAGRNGCFYKLAFSVILTFLVCSLYSI